MSHDLPRPKGKTAINKTFKTGKDSFIFLINQTGKKCLHMDSKENICFAQNLRVKRA